VEVKSGRCVRLTTLPPSWVIVTQSGNLNFLEPSGHLGPVMGLIYLYHLDALIFQIYFWNKTLFVSNSSSVQHQEFFTVHTAMLYVIQVLLTACEWDQG